MAEMTADLLGQRIREARSRAGLSQQELAGRVGLDRTALGKIETGTRRVSALELSDLARALGTRMASFFEDPAPGVVAHRSSQGLDTADSQVDLLLSDLADEVRFIHSLQPLRVTPALRQPPTASQDAEAWAQHARHLLKVDPAEPLVGLADRLAQIGLLVFTRPLGTDTADAGTVLIGDLGVSLVNSDNLVGRRRLAAAHELGHFLARDGYAVDRLAAETHEPHESRLDHFARALLLPAKGVARRWERLSKQHGLRETAVVVGSEYRVDMSTLARRLADLDLVGPSQAGDIREVRTTRTDLIELDLHPVQEMEGTTQPRVFQQAVLQLVRQERLSPARAVDLLWHLVDEDEIPLLPIRDLNRIWDYVS